MEKKQDFETMPFLIFTTQRLLLIIIIITRHYYSHTT